MRELKGLSIYFEYVCQVLYKLQKKQKSGVYVYWRLVYRKVTYRIFHASSAPWQNLEQATEADNG